MEENNCILTDDVLRTAFESFAGQQGMVEKLKWYLGSAYSAERWFQFEYAYCLSTVLGKAAVVDCEKGWVDIVVYDSSHRQNPLATLEVKMCGNWFTREDTTQDRFKLIQRDIDKARSRPGGLALSFWILARPTTANEKCAWITKQVDGGIGIAVEKLEGLVTSRCPGMECVARHPYKNVDGLEHLEVVLYRFRNESLATASNSSG